MVDISCRSATGNLMYPATCTRSDLAASVYELSKFSQGIAHWEGVKRVVRNVSSTVGEGLLYKRGVQVEVWGYSDAGHEKETSKGRSGYAFLSAGAAIN